MVAAIEPSLAVEHRFRGIRQERLLGKEREREKQAERRGHLLWIINGRRKPPLMRLRDLKLGTTADSNLPSYSHSIVITLFPFSPLSEPSK